MSLSNDIRSYADNAFERGRKVVDQAQAQFNDVTGQANEFVGKIRGTVEENVSTFSSKAGDTVADLRAQAEKAINLDAIKNAIEPYLNRAKGYSNSVSERAEDLYASVKKDKRVAALVTRTEELTDTVVERVQSLTGRTGKAAPKKATKAAATKAAPVKAAAKTTAAKAPAKKAAPRKTVARKAAAK